MCKTSKPSKLVLSQYKSGTTPTQLYLDEITRSCVIVCNLWYPPCNPAPPYKMTSVQPGAPPYNPVSPPYNPVSPVQPGAPRTTRNQGGALECKEEMYLACLFAWNGIYVVTTYWHMQHHAWAFLCVFRACVAQSALHHEHVASFYPVLLAPDPNCSICHHMQH